MTSFSLIWKKSTHSLLQDLNISVIVATNGIPSIVSGDGQNSTPVPEVAKRYQVFEDFDELVQQIRNLKGFERFLLGPLTSVKLGGKFQFMP
jgi:hypothetical protein